MFSTDLFVFVWGANSVRHGRLGISVSRRFGPSVARNRFRRCVKEAFRQSAIRDLPFDVHVRPKGQIVVEQNEFFRVFEAFAAYIRR